MAKVAVLVVHGIGWYDDGTKRKLLDKTLTRLMDPERSVRRLVRALEKEKLGPKHYVVELAEWGKEIESYQQRFVKTYSERLDWDFARRVVISALGDAAQYSAAVYSNGTSSFPAHDTIHATVARSLAKLAAACGPKAPLVVIGHSLGAHICSNHIYDEQNGKTHGGQTPLERMETMKAFITLGCNIPLFVMGTEKPEPIELNGASWVNYFDADDVLGFPLVPLYFPDGKKPAKYDLTDIEVDVGPALAGWTPVSHGGYWDDRDVVRGIAKQIRAAGA